MTPTPQESRAASAWTARHLLSPDVAGLPFSFRCGQQTSSEWLGACLRRYETRALDANRTEHTVAFSDPATGLELRCVATEYHDFPAVEWLLSFKNSGSANSPKMQWGHIYTFDNDCCRGDIDVVELWSWRGRCALM